ncbi:3-dehydroquinate synthase [Leekyejoonella antrihumi]|uniref:3-dehydroquinate synthase n=1 Tax=Leekyejoonella antrihumi TaxID=1660198 RepID=A0A563DY22_9MICO|nr:3-dehydroquinate synthase [Leekyejoonella antrihumi]TWP34862.1 3-dehydroquinate synthase [Leekyejoonella antrihumi]
MTEHSVIRVADGYDVVIGEGVLAQVGGALPTGTARVLVVHAPVMEPQAGDLAATFDAQGLQTQIVALPDAEGAKTAQVAADLWARLGQAGFTRSDVVVAVGGGATTDLGGFVAATWLRGVQVVQVPTSLLGMVDAAVGGKTGINTAEGKNLVGSFHPPHSVWCDLAVLRTLPPADLAAGLAEVVKCGFIRDPRILDLVEQHPREAVDPTSAVLRELVERAVQVKADVVAVDLKESSLREILNYGHTFGHAIEQREHYTWRHGDAVAVGMVYAAELARLVGLIGADLVERHRRVLASLGLPTTYPAGHFDELLTVMRRDKKTRGSMLRFVALESVGRVTRIEGPADDMLRAAYDAVSS